MTLPEEKCQGCGCIWEPDGITECCPVCGHHQKAYLAAMRVGAGQVKAGKRRRVRVKRKAPGC